MSNPPKSRLAKRKRSLSEGVDLDPLKQGDVTSVLPHSELESKKPRQVSAASTSSMFDPMNFKDEFAEVKELCQVSTESTSSMFDPMNFPKGSQQDLSASTSSMFDPMNFSKDPQPDLAGSTSSMFDPMNFKINPKSLQKTVQTTDPSGMSLASDASMYTPLVFSPEHKRPVIPECCVCEEPFEDDPVYFTCKHVACTRCVIKGSETVEGQSQTTDLYHCTECGTHQTIAPNQQVLKLLTLNRHLFDISEKLKTDRRNKYSFTSEGNGDERSPLNHIYTSLSINFRNREVPREHELGQMYREKKSDSQEQEIDLSEVFESSPRKFPRTILTNGVAGIGKSFSVQKFIVDWAEDTSNKDVQFVFNLSFRELNLMKEDMSLLQILKVFHPAVSDLNPDDLEQTKVIVILDGFDESRFHLDFSKTQKVSSVEEPASVPSLIINLIKGDLLSKAQLWITSRPAASYQIPGQFIHKVTEIQGFNDQQKKTYFEKKFSHNPGVAKMVISHIESSQTLDMLCQIPIFCWITSVLLEEIFGGEEQTEAPQTLTEMMGAFLFVQTKRSSRKYDQNPERERINLLKAKRDFLLKLGKLAFTHLLNNSLIFYEDDLKQCGLDSKAATVNSGFFNSVLREEQLFLKQKVFYFVHLTVQEFFAALYVFDCFTNNKLWAPELSSFLGLDHTESSRPPLFDLLKMVVKNVLERNSGHLYFFQRFLLGLMVESNQKFIKALLVPVKSGQEIVRKILGHLKAIKRNKISPDACINLFQCMVEMGDNKITDHIHDYLMEKDRARIVLTPLHCSALAFTILVSKSVFEELDLKSYNTSEEGRRRLIPAVRSSKKANLSECRVSEAILKPLALALSFPHSSLRDLDLNNCDLRDPGVELLCKGLMSPLCKLRVLGLSGCLVTEVGCGFLVSALKSNPSHLKELDLSYNDLGASGETALTDLKNDPQYNLSHLLLNVSHGGSHRMTPGLRKYWCKFSWHTKKVQTGVQFSDDHREVSRSGETPDPVLVWGGQALSGRCYWEIEASVPCNIGVAYQGRELEKTEFRLGENEKSWSFVCSEEGCYAFHNNKSTMVAVPLCLRSSRLALYLDHAAGVLSFYKVSAENRTLLHTFRREEKFPKDLFPVAVLKPKSSVRFLCEAEEQKRF